MTAAGMLPRRTVVEPTDPLVQTLLPRRDDRLLGKAVVVAVLLHLPLVFLSLPERTAPPPPMRTAEPLALSEYVLPPPPREPPPEQPRPPRREMVPPIAVPWPDDHDRPLAEEAPRLDDTEPAFDLTTLDDVLAPPVAPPLPDGPFEIFDLGVTPPVPIDDCRVKPEYPELARISRRPGKVFLRAVIRADGTVGEIEVLAVRPPGLGFEDAAIAAVQQWCYEPATQHGRPVDVYFTINVTFELH